MTISRHNLLKLGLVIVTTGVVGAACSDDTSVRPLGPFSGEGGGTGTGGSGSASGGAKGNTGGASGSTGGKSTGSGGSGTGTGGASGNTGGKATGGTSSGTGGANSNTGGKANGNTGGSSTGGAVGNTGGNASGGADGNTGGNSGTVTCDTIMPIIGNNHVGAAHMLDPAITSDDVMAAADASYDLSEGGDPPHTHSITVTAADFAKLAQGMTVMVTSDNVEGHTHVVTLKCGA